MTKKSLDAATRAVAERRGCPCSAYYDEFLCLACREYALAALCAALPAEFDAEKEALMRKAYGDAASTGSNPHLAVYRDLRAHLLREDA